jgi:hypothetical protein
MGKAMRDRRFVAEHRGGPLTGERHRQLMRWAHDCAARAVRLLGESADGRLIDALKVARAWEKREATVGDARRAALGAIAAARGSANTVAVAAARAAGHAAATAHMADHSLGAAEYALRAVKAAGRSIETERKWQDAHLPLDVHDLVLSARGKRGAFRAYKARQRRP